MLESTLKTILPEFNPSIPQIRTHTIPNGAVIVEPIYLIHLASADETPLLACPKNNIIAKENSQASIIEIILNSGNITSSTNSHTQITLEKGAKINHYFIQHSFGTSTQTAEIQVFQKTFSQYQGIALISGGKINQASFQIDLSEPKANANFTALEFGSKKNQTNLSLNMLHHAPNCQSVTETRIIAKDNAKSDFTGKIYIAEDAAFTNASLQSKNLLLDTQAQIKTRPQLEIYHDNIQCSHGATVGSLDEEALFYLKSRGIEHKEARNLMISGFLNPIVMRLPISIQQYLMEIIHEF